MHIAIVEDMTTDARHLTNLIEAYYRSHPSNLHEPHCQISIYKDFVSFQKAFRRLHFHIVFLDIFLSPTENGYDIARQIRCGTSDPTVPIIFTTSCRDYAVESYEVEAVGYLLKPIRPDALENCMNRLYLHHFKQAPKTLRVLSNRQYLHIPLESIMYIVTNGNGSSIITQHDTILTSMSLHTLCSQIDHPDFLLAKRGHLVNLHYVQSAAADSFLMQDGARIPLRVKGSHELLRLYEEYLLRQD